MDTKARERDLPGGGGHAAERFGEGIAVRLVARSADLAAALRQLTARAPLELTVDWASGEAGGGGALPRERYARRLPVSELGGRRIRYVRVEAIVWIEAESQYVKLHGKEESFLVREPAMTMQRLERRLDPERFVRISRSYIVNLERVVALRMDPPSRRYVLLPGGRELAVSQDRWLALKRALAGE
jgi:two-component system, LytTR family, response regulator